RRLGGLAHQDQVVHVHGSLRRSGPHERCNRENTSYCHNKATHRRLSFAACFWRATRHALALRTRFRTTGITGGFTTGNNEQMNLRYGQGTRVPPAPSTSSATVENAGSR